MLKKNDFVAHEVIGYFARDVKMFNMVRCPNHPYAQCGFKVEDGNIDFYSYSSLLFRIPIKSIRSDSWLRYEVTCYYGEVLPNYSRTTINHTRFFAQTLNSNAGYHTLNEIAKNGERDATIYVDKDIVDAIISMY